jgi:peptide/nickel transport system substrate-binding protein
MRTRTKHRLRKRTGGLLGVLALVVVAACGGGSGDDGGGGGSSAADESGDLTTETTVAGDPETGGELVVATLFDSFGFDPTKLVHGIADGTAALAVFDSLMVYDEDAQVVPYLAESLESEDSQTWTLGLRPGVTFSDGTPLDAEAVKFNIERHQDPANQSRAVRNAGNIETMTVVDDQTLELQLRFPWAAFPEILIGTLGTIGSPTALADPEAFNREPVGAGPFVVSEWSPGDHISMVRNEDYWQDGKPYLDEITFRLVPDTETRFESVRAGEVQLGQSTNGAEIAEAAETDNMQGYPANGPGITIMMNTTQAPFDDPRVRMAILQATDRAALRDVVFEGVGADPPNEFLVSSRSGYRPEDIEYPDHDPEAAAALIEEVEAEVGPVSFTYKCHTQPDMIAMAELLEQMWGQAGMDVELQTADQNALVIDIFTRNYSISCFGAVGQEDPDLAYYNTLHSESPTNATGYSNPEVDEALDTGRRSTDEETRRESYRVVQQALAEDVPLFQAVTSPWGWFGSGDVRGLFARRNGTIVLADAWLAP